MTAPDVTTRQAAAERRLLEDLDVLAQLGEPVTVRELLAASRAATLGALERLQDRGVIEFRGSGLRRCEGDA